MNIIILAGGKGQRIWPLTSGIPKVLLGISGEPCLCHLLENVTRIRGITSITVAIDRNDEGYFRKYQPLIELVSKRSIKFSVHELQGNNRPKGPLTKLREILDDSENCQITGDDFCIIGGDNVFGFELRKFASFYRQVGDCIAIQDLSSPVDGSQFGVPKLDDSGQLERIDEKPKRKVKHRSTACYCYRKERLYTISEYLDKGGPDNLGLFAGWLTSNKPRLNTYVFGDEWYDIGTLDGLLGANAYLLQQAKTAQGYPAPSNGTLEIEPPVLLGEKLLVRDSTIGPNV